MNKAAELIKRLPEFNAENFNTWDVESVSLWSYEAADLLEAQAAQIEALQADADRYRWLRPRMIGVDFDYQESGATALSFEMPSNASFGANCDMNIDAAKGNV